MYVSTPMLDVYNDHRSPVLSTVIVDTNNRTLQTTWIFFIIRLIIGHERSSRSPDIGQCNPRKDATGARLLHERRSALRSPAQERKTEMKARTRHGP